MAQYIPKSALVAEIEMLRKILPIDEFQPKEQNKIDWLAGKEFVIIALKVFLDTLEVKEVEEEHTNRKTADIASAMQEVEEKSRAFTEAHQGESSDGILAQMRGEEPVSEDLDEEIECSLPQPAWGWHEDYFGKSGPAYSMEQMKEIAKHFYSRGLAQKG